MQMLEANGLALFKRFDTNSGGTIGKDKFAQALAQVCAGQLATRQRES